MATSPALDPPALADVLAKLVKEQSLLKSRVIRIDRTVAQLKVESGRYRMTDDERSALTDLAVSRGLAAAEQRIFKRWRVRLLVAWSAVSSLLLVLASSAAIIHYLHL